MPYKYQVQHETGSKRRFANKRVRDAIQTAGLNEVQIDKLLDLLGNSSPSYQEVLALAMEVKGKN